MANEFPSARGGVVFFDEDFDLPPPSAAAPEPEIIVPVFSAEELAAAKEIAAAESRTAALGEAATSARAAASQALATVAAELIAARAEAAEIAEQSAEAIVRLLLDCFATAFPALSTRHGPEEVAAVLRAILPALHREPKVTVRVNPHTAAALTEEIRALDPDLTSNVRVVPTDALTRDEVRVAWENGTAVRDTKALWRQIEDVLAPAGLLTAKQTVRDHALVD